MSNSSLLILLASDTLAYRFIDHHHYSRLGRKYWKCQRLLPKLRQYLHLNTLTVAPATLNYLLSSLDEDNFDENRIQKIQEMEKDGIKIPQGYDFERVEVNQHQALLYAAELEYAIANQPSALITYASRQSNQPVHPALYIWDIEELFNRLRLKSIYQTDIALAENDLRADHPSAQTSEDQTRSQATPSRSRKSVVWLLVTLLGSQLLNRDDRSSKSQPSQTPQKSTPDKVAQEKKPIGFHAPTTSHSNSNLLLNANENITQKVDANILSNANYRKLNQLVNQGGQFSGLWLLSQISKNDNRSDASSETTQQSFAPTSSSLVRNYNLGTLMNAQNTESQHSGSPDRALSKDFELDGDRAIFIPNPFIFAGSDFDHLNMTDSDATLLLRSDLLLRSPLPFNQAVPAVSLMTPSSESANQPSDDRPDLSADIGKPRTQELEKTHSIVTPEIVVIAPPQILDGSGGIHSFTLTTGSYEVRNFGGVGTNRNPSDDIIQEVDTLYFQGPQLIAKNLLLDQQGNDLTITFADVQNISIILKDFNLENLDNFLTISETPLMLGNIVFNEETSIQDSFDVIDANLIIAQVFNRNSVTFLNDSDNDVMGFDDSNDVINSQGGNDFLKGLGGDDILRGGASDDILWGGTGADILDGGTGNNWLTGGAGADVFRLCRNGLSQVIDFQVGEDRIGLPADIQIDQVAIEPGTELNSSTLIRFKPDGSLLMSLSGVTASSLTTDIFLPNASSLIRD